MRLIPLLILIGLRFGCLAQPNELDSLTHLLESHAGRDTATFRLLIRMSDLSLPEPEKSKQYLDEAAALADELGYEEGIAQSYCSLANLYWNISEFPKAIENGLLALRGYEKLNDPKGLYESYNTLAGIHTSLEDFDKAIEYMNMILVLGKNRRIDLDYGELYYNMAWLLLKQNRNDEGLELVSQSLEIFAKREKPFELGANYFLRAKALQSLARWNDALKDLRQSIRINKSTDHPYVQFTLASAHEAVGEILIRQGKLKLAAKHLDSALVLARQINSPNLRTKVYGHKVELFEADGNFKEALAYERLKGALEDSIFNSEKSKQLADAETRYETEKKNKTIQLLERDTRIQKLWRNILVIGMIGVLIAAVFVVFWYREREKNNRRLFDLRIDYLTARHTELSQKYKDPITLPDSSVSPSAILESQDQRFLKKALEIVEKHLSDPRFGVEKMAEEMAMTRAGLHRKLKTLSGTSPSDFIRSIRLKRAAIMLRDNVDSVSQIAFAVGFEDQSYFSKAFKKQFGVPPSSYGADPPRALGDEIT